MEQKLSFADFYSEIRKYFCACIVDYEGFKQCEGLDERIRYLLRNQVVQTWLRKLEQQHDQEARRKEADKKSSCRILNKKSKKLPQLTRKAMLTSSRKVGRKIVAKEKILPGEEIIVEKPFATILYPQFQGSHCLCCFKVVLPHQTPVPCRHCSRVNFCSEECLLEADGSFHWAECNSLRFLQDDEQLGSLALLVFRLLITAGRDKVLVVDSVEEKDTVYDSESYASVYFQVSHENERDPGEHFRRCLTALYLAHFLRRARFFDDGDGNFFSGDNEELVKVCAAAAKHLESCSCNAYEISELSRSRIVRELGGAVYPTVSLTNHSCFPNTMRYNEGDACILRAVRTISPGEEISDNYGEFYQVSSLSDRQERLQRQYFFTCECKACKEDWPMAPELKMRQTIFVCAGCSSVLPNRSKGIRCPKCKSEARLGKLVRMLEGFEDRARRAVDALGTDNWRECADLFASMLAGMEKNVQMPCWQFVLCQQVLTHAYSLNGNFNEDS